MNIESEKEKTDVSTIWGRISKKLFTLGVETRGIQLVPLDERIDKPYSKIFFIFFSMNVNILSFSSGTLGPVIFGLGLRDACLTIILFNLLCCAFPSYIATWGPKLGMRQIIISRYSFGYYGVILICILDLIGLIGFAILNCILGGQALASVTDGDLSWSVGIVVIAVISLMVSFCGFTVLNWYERISWFPVLITFIIASIVGGNHLSSSTQATAVAAITTPATASAVLSFASTLAGFSISFSSLSCDCTSYYRPNVSSWKLFLSAYAGFLLPIVSLQCFGAAVAIAASSVPDWEQGYTSGNVGGLLEAMLHPLGNFGKFLMVLLSLSVAGNNVITFYAISINLQAFVPVLVSVPRYMFSLVATAVVVPISIVGAHRFYITITNFLGLIGYWTSIYTSIILLEHLHFRKNDPSLYDKTAWDIPKRLPSGIAAGLASVVSFGVAVPCMNQVWFVGDVARLTGDIGFEVSFVVSGLLYFLFRWIEIRYYRGFL